MVAAFDIYVKMGEDRSIPAVAKQIGRSGSTVQNWSKQYEWRLRLKEWQEQSAELAKEEIKGEFFADSNNLRKFKYQVLDELKKRFLKQHWCDNCETARCSVNEMISILNVTKVELGEPTNITKNTTPDPRNDPFALILGKFFPPAPDDHSKAD